MTTTLTKSPKTKREVIPLLTTHEGMAALVGEITSLQLEAAAKLGEIQTMTAVAERVLADQIAPAQQHVEELGARIKARLVRVQSYAIEHREALFPDPKKKSFELPTATVGFAFSSKPKVVLTNGENSTDEWETAALRIEGLTWAEKYLRIPLPEINKEALIADRDILPAAQLATVGLRIDQPEKFYVTPKSETAAKAT